MMNAGPDAPLLVLHDENAWPFNNDATGWQWQLGGNPYKLDVYQTRLRWQGMLKHTHITHKMGSVSERRDASFSVFHFQHPP